MRFPTSLAALVLLAGCSTVSAVRDAWSWDPSAPRQSSAVVLPPEQVSAMASRLAELQLRRNQIRTRIGAEPDIRVRLRLYEELHSVGQQLSPLERQLMAAAAR